ncbi:type II toxin-antitoxin system RelE/ParE family toxin [Gaopeijia maritima]|uniref:type II toxin-antitoxin system RelE/ParE family toxin n=1 Tax=Gaopeijia maritima TaxID=3119007 RepID=UPI00324DBBC6
MSESPPKPLYWVGSSLADVRAFPEAVRTDVGFALWVAQQGQRPRQAKVMKEIVSGAGVLEIVERHAGDAYRVVYTVRFTDAVYVLYAFQKKSRRGTKTPRHDIDLIRDRLRDAEAHHGGK